MRTAVGESEDSGRMGEHFVEGVTVSVGVAEERHHEQRFAVAFAEPVVELFDRFDTPGACEGGNRSICCGLVVDRVAEQVLTVESVDYLGGQRLGLAQDVHRGL